MKIFHKIFQKINEKEAKSEQKKTAKQCPVRNIDAEILYKMLANTNLAAAHIPRMQD